MNPGNRLRELRKAAGLSQAEVAEAIGLSQSQISQHENGQVSLTLEWLRRYARVLGCAPADVLDSRDNPDRLAEDERAIIERYRSGDPIDRQMLLRVADVRTGYRPPDAEAAA